ncbi:hypothetical protein [Komagataeibacter medellinensis]|nr:hypothetical protein [Komagataeibacter medellinensis]
MPDAQSPAAWDMIDGQPRLTTLFLLHWYLALKEGEGTDFRSHFAPCGTNRLTHHTRENAWLFLDVVVQENVMSSPRSGAY